LYHGRWFGLDYLDAQLGESATLITGRTIPFSDTWYHFAGMEVLGPSLRGQAAEDDRKNDKKGSGEFHDDRKYVAWEETGSRGPRLDGWAFMGCSDQVTAFQWAYLAPATAVCTLSVDADGSGVCPKCVPCF